MKRTLSKVERALVTSLPKGSKVLVAVSGGRDSVVLLHAVHSVRRLLKLEIGVAHFDHRARAGSALDAGFVHDLASELELPFFLGHAPSRNKGENFEAWARAHRYDFLLEILTQEGFDYILTAHHAQDVAETLLMRLVSNKELTSILGFDVQRRCLRPFLSVTREVIDSYAKKHRCAFREDETNTDTGFLRNRVRHEILPLLESRFQPRAVEILAERAQALQSDAEAFAQIIAPTIELLNRSVFGSRPWMGRMRKALAEAPAGLQWRIVESGLLQSIGFPLGRGHAAKVVGFIQGNAPQLELPGGTRLVRKNGALLIKKKASPDQGR